MREQAGEVAPEPIVSASTETPPQIEAHAASTQDCEALSQKKRIVGRSKCILELTRRGISHEVIKLVKAEPAWRGQSTYIALPGARPDGQWQSVLHRVIDARSNGAERYYAAPERLDALWWPTPEVGDGALVVVTEGPVDAMTFTELGICSTSLPHGVSSATNAGILDEIATLYTEFERVVLCLDGDAAGKDATVRLIAGLDERMPDREEGYLVANLPVGSKDANELLQKDGPGAVDELISGATSTFAERHPRGWLKDRSWLYRPIPPAQYVIEGLLEIGHVALFEGAGESLKSMVAYAVGLAATTGGRRVGPFTVLGGYGSIIINGEMSERQVRSRIQRLLRGADVENDERLANLRVAHGSKFKVDDPEWIKALARVLDSAPPTVLVIDSFRAVICRTDENNSAQVRASIDQLRTLAEGRHAIILIAHEAKVTRGTAAKHATAGSTDLFNVVDVTVRFEMDNPKEPARITASKARDHADDRGPWLTKIEDVDGDGLAVVEVKAPPAGAKAAKAIAGLLVPVEAVLRANGASMSLHAVRTAVKASGITAGIDDLKAALGQLVGAGTVTSGKKNPMDKHFRYTIAKP